MRAFAVVGLVLVLTACATGTGARRDRAAATGAGFPPTVAAPGAHGSAIVEQARAMLGQPYRWGGAAPGGFDCSGLVTYAARRAGLSLPRTAREQLRTGSPVARRDLATGDLVFLHLTGKELHVGIAIDNRRFVHAPSTGGYVRIDSLDAAPYSSGFLAARRIDFLAEKGADPTLAGAALQWSSASPPRQPP